MLLVIRTVEHFSLSFLASCLSASLVVFLNKGVFLASTARFHRKVCIVVDTKHAHRVFILLSSTVQWFFFMFFISLICAYK